MTKTAHREIGLFPGSFDPFTKGHEDIVGQSLGIFKKVIIAIGVNPGKSTLFSVDERIAMIREVFAKEAAVEVVSFAGLVVNYAHERGAHALIRGLRTEADFSYEMPMAMTNRRLAPDLQTVFLPTNMEFAYVSSSLVREVGLNGGDISGFVPAAVKRWVDRKFNSRP